MDGPTIEVDSLLVRRGTFELGPLSLKLTPGLTALLGRNGAGKSTLINTLVGLHKPRSGSVSLGALDPYRRAHRREFMRVVGLVPQDASLPGSVSTEDALDYAAWLKGVPRRTTLQRVSRILDSLHIADLRERKIGSLSGGERRRVSIALALVHEPPLLVLDEPTVGLDPVQRVSLREVLLVLSRDRTLLLSTHLVEDVASGVDRVVALGSGRQVYDGTVDDLKTLAGADDVGESELERGIWHVLTRDAR